jgi:hypothetical protein
VSQAGVPAGVRLAGSEVVACVDVFDQAGLDGLPAE